MLFYIAEPIDLVDSMVDRRLIKLAVDFLNRNNHSAYLPSQAFQLGGQPDTYVSRINEEALEMSDGVVAFLVGGVKSVGVPAEIEMCRVKGIPVLIVTDLADVSWFVKGWESDPVVEVWQPIGKSYDQYGSWLHGGVAEFEEALERTLSKAILIRDRVEDFTELHRVDLSGTLPLVFEPTDDDKAEPLLPTRGHSDDAGFDLYVSEDTEIPPKAFVDVPCGVAVDLPDGVWGLVTGRSSTLRVRGLHVANGIIDTGYTGPLFAGCQNWGEEPVLVKRGERVAQVILMPALAPSYTAEFGKVRDKVRGNNGFGSTGL